MNTTDLLIQGAIANIAEKSWKQDISIKILEKYLKGEL